MDKLLGAFTNKYIDQLNVEDLNELIKLLEIDMGKNWKKNFIVKIKNNEKCGNTKESITLMNKKSHFYS